MNDTTLDDNNNRPAALAQTNEISDFTNISALFKEPSADVSPIIRICFEYAKEKHSNSPDEKKRFREKAGVFSKMPSYLHPLMAYNILRAVWFDTKHSKKHIHKTSNRDYVLAAALLHDVLEDAVGSQEILEGALATRFMKEGIPDSRGIAHTIAGLVWELTNDFSIKEGKRIRQIDDADRYTSEAKLIKLAEMSASVLEDVLIPPKNLDDKYEFVRKSRSIAHAMREVHPKFAKLVIALCQDAQLYYSADLGSEDGVKTKEGINFKNISKKAAHYRFPSESKINFETIRHPDEAAAERGIVSVTVSRQGGEVLRFEILAEPKYTILGTNDEIEDVTTSFEKNPLNHVYESPPCSSVAGRYIRRMEFEKPMPLKEFLEITKNSASEGLARRQKRIEIKKLLDQEDPEQPRKKYPEPKESCPLEAVFADRLKASKYCNPLAINHAAKSR